MGLRNIVCNSGGELCPNGDGCCPNATCAPTSDGVMACHVDCERDSDCDGNCCAEVTEGWKVCSEESFCGR